MIDLLNRYSNKYYLQLGDYKFSPILKLTAGFSLEYCKSIIDGTCSEEPFIFCFPEKKAAALWTSISILTNFYLEDYVNIGDEGVPLKTGNKVFIFGCVAEIERINRGSVSLKFKDKAIIELDDRLKPQLSIAPSNRALNLFKRYDRAKKEARYSRNPISKILYPNGEVLINQRNLKSKILLVAGRGQVKKFHNFLETVEIYGEKLGKVFPEGENLIIAADLKRFKRTSNSNDEADFIRLLKRAGEAPKFEEIFESLQHLLDLYSERGEISDSFDELFNELISEAIDELPELKILKEKYPGVSAMLKNDFRTVVLNDVQQLSEYPDTIESFLQANIPVIVFADRKVISIEDISTFNDLFNQRPNAYRLNWNKKKISSLVSDTEESNGAKSIERRDGVYNSKDQDSLNEALLTEDFYIDQALWNQALRYEAQSIHISTYPGGNLDLDFPRLLKCVKSLDEFEILQKSFYNNFYPAIFALKNSSSSSRTISELIARFKSDLMNVGNFIPSDISEKFIKAIEISEAFTENNKNIEYDQNIFSISVPLDFDKSFTIPDNIGFTNIPSIQTQSILFTGYPFKEYSGNYLINSVCDFFVPEIEIRCWPIEASLTYNYLKRRIEGGYFLDNLPAIIKADNTFLLKTALDIQTEIDSYLIIDQAFEESNEVEKSLQTIEQFKYKGYQLPPEKSANWKVNCDVLNFDDGSFMFLKKGSSILCLSEDLKGGVKVMKKSSDEFFPGDIVFRYVKDRGALVEISKRDPLIKQSYEKLEFWRSTLHELYESNSRDAKTLEDFLRKKKTTANLGGNPAHYNIDRWLFDDELISPDYDNLKLIFTAAEVANVEDRLAELTKAYKIATAHRISLSTRIKKQIAKKISKIQHLSEDFQINLDGENINVETRTIATVEKFGVIVDYFNTRKILC